jgi:AraC-like DNA-binding protein
MNHYHFTPYIRLAMFDTILNEFKMDRAIWDYEIIYIAEGKMLVTVNDIQYECVEDDIIFLRPRVHHILESGYVKVVQPHVHFDFNEDEYSKNIYIPFITEDKMTHAQKKWFRKDILTELNIDLPPVIRLTNSYIVKSILYRLIDEFTYKYPYSEYMQRALLIELFTEIVRGYNLSTQNIPDKHIESMNQLVKYIYSHADENLSLDDLANIANLSKWYLIKVFKNTFNQSPQKYMFGIRIKRAIQLIQFTNMSMKEIAIQMNFENQQSFSRWFKNLDGHSPMFYRIRENVKTLSITKKNVAHIRQK